MSLIKHPPESMHFMVDIETLDTRPSSVILSVGICPVLAADRASYTSYYAELDPKQAGRTQSMDTVYWWKEQTGCPDKGTKALADALLEIQNYFWQITSKPIIWAKGIDFDTVILAHAYDSYRMRAPWKYNDVRDFRTVKKLFQDKIGPGITNTMAHHALEDAIFQSEQLESIGIPLA